MRVRELGEDALIAALAEIYRARDGVEVGIGDDGAVIASASLRQVVTTDLATEGIHFNRNWCSPRDIGAKVTIANLADIFAMGGIPQFMTVAMTIPADEEVSYILEIARGIEELARTHRVSVVGGDLVAGHSLTISITALGSVDSPVLRSGAHVGNLLFLTRGTGRSLAGLLLLREGLATPESPDVRIFQRPEFHPEDLLEFGFENMNALMDVSDGLRTDLFRLAKASGVGINLDIQNSELGYLQELSSKLEISAIELFLSSGEEHSFIVAADKAKISKVPSTWIKLGEVAAGVGITLRGQELSMTEKSWHW